MNAMPPQATITITLTDLEALIRRTVQEAVRKAVHEELLLIFRDARPSVIEDWEQEGSNDLEADEALLAEALVLRQQYRKNRTRGQDWEKFKAELKVAEDAGEPVANYN